MSGRLEGGGGRREDEGGQREEEGGRREEEGGLGGGRRMQGRGMKDGQSGFMCFNPFIDVGDGTFCTC